MNLKGIIASVKNQGREDSRYYIIGDDDGAVREMKSAIALKAGEAIMTNDSGEMIQSAEIEENGSALQGVSERASRLAHSVLNKKAYLTGNGKVDNATAKMWEKLQVCEELLVRKLACAAPVIVRFHNDADGSSGAYGLYKSINELAGRKKELEYKHNITWIMHQNVSYTTYDANTDTMIAGSYSSIEKPLLVIIDFGTSLESNNGMERVRDKFDIIWLDHHPIVEGFKGLSLDNYVNPWNFGADSNYAAGFLACVFSKTFSRFDTKEIENASLCGDCSDYARQDEPGVELSLLLDLLTSDAKVAFGAATTNVTPMEIEKLAGDNAKMAELLGFAKTRLSDVTAAALRSMKRYKGEGAYIYVLDFEGMRDEQSKYPLPGRFSSKLLDKIVETKGEPAIVMVHSGKYISVRVSKDLSDRVNLIHIIAGIKESFGELVEAGGGHISASGIKLADKMEKDKVVREVVSLLKKQLSRERINSGGQAAV